MFFDDLSYLETLLLYGGVAMIFYLAFLQYRSIKRHRRHRRHLARKRQREAAERVNVS